MEKKKVIIFGIKDLAELAYIYLKNDDRYTISAFTVSKSYLPTFDSLFGKPIVTFESIEHLYSPEEYFFLAPMTHRDMNRARQQVYCEIKVKGYKCISYIHPTTSISSEIEVGENCFILENVIIQPCVTIGNNNIIWSGSVISHHSKIDDHVFIAPRVGVSGNVHIRSNCFLGIGANIRDSISLGEGTQVAMGASVTHDTEPWTYYSGSPAKKMIDS